MTTGEYSDYSIRGLFRVLKDLDKQEVYTNFPRKDDEWFDPEGFLHYLIEKEYLEEIDHQEWTFSTYNEFQLDE